MMDLVRLIVWTVVDLLRSRAALEAEILTLRQQIIVLQRTASKRQTFSAIDRWMFVCLYRLLSGVRDALSIVKPETVVKWPRAGFRLYWRWKSKPRGGRPTVPLEIRKPRDEHCQSSVGSASDPWRTPQARHRYRTNQRGQVHGQAKSPAIPRLEDVPSQSCRRHRRDGSVRRTDNLIWSALRLVDCGAWSTADFMVLRHSTSDRRLDRKSDHGSLRLGTSSPLSHSSPGSGLWAGLHPKASINGHLRSTVV